jgi:hypothetical protein
MTCVLAVPVPQLEYIIIDLFCVIATGVSGLTKIVRDRYNHLNTKYIKHDYLKERLHEIFDPLFSLPINQSLIPAYHTNILSNLVSILQTCS